MSSHDTAPIPPTAAGDAVPAAPPGPGRLRPRSLLVFAVVAFAFFAVCAAPFWFLAGGITHPLYTLVIGIGMFAPTVATVVVAKAVDKTSWRAAVGLRFRGLWKRLGLWSVLGVLVLLAINIASAVILVLRGAPGDLTGRTWARTLTETMAEAGAPMPTAAAVAIVLAVSLAGLLLTVVPALGEEIGWRGWLWRELKPLGLPGALVAGGAIWSLWHLPVTLIGHNYPDQPRFAAVAMFIVACVAMNALFGAITERAGGNPIPAAFAHATVNSTFGLSLSIIATGGTMEAVNWFLDTPLGLTGAALMLLAAWLIMPRSARSGFGPRSGDPSSPDAHQGR